MHLSPLISFFLTLWLPGYWIGFHFHKHYSSFNCFNVNENENQWRLQGLKELKKTIESERIKGRVSSYITLYGLIRVRSWRGEVVSLMTRPRTIWELWLRCISKYLSNKELMLTILFRFLSSKWKISFFTFSFFFNRHCSFGRFQQVLSIHLLFHLMLVYWTNLFRFSMGCHNHFSFIAWSGARNI